MRISDVTARVGRPSKVLFKIPCLEIKRGEHLLVEGPSGYGKTTLLHLLAGLMRPDQGEIVVGSHKLLSMNDAELSAFRRTHIGLVFQKLNLLDHLTVMENILLTLPSGILQLGQAKTALENVNIGHLAGRRTSGLSLGEQQRVAVARILARKPDVVLADEPTSSLDEANSEAVISALQSLGKNTTLMVVSHDQRLRSRFKKIVDFRQWVAP